LYASARGEAHMVCTAAPYMKTADGYRLITAGHCVQEIPAEAKFFVEDDIDGPLTPVVVVKAVLDGSMDFAIFDLKTDKVYALPVFDESPLRIGDPVVSVHFARGVTKQLSYGRVSSGELMNSGKCLDFCGGDFLVQMVEGPGSSGALVVSERTHRAIGIVVASGGDLGAVIEPIAKFATFMSLPTQPHPAEE